VLTNAVMSSMLLCPTDYQASAREISFVMCEGRMDMHAGAYQ